MRRLAGQAARHGGRLAHVLMEVMLALVVFGAVAIGYAGWRLAQGPVELPWLARLLAERLTAGSPGQIALGGAAIAWEGFHGGLDRPIDIRLAGLAVSDATGRRIVTVPRATLLISAAEVLLGRLVPTAIELDGPRLHVVRSADGGIGLDLGGEPAAGSAGPAVPELSLPGAPAGRTPWPWSALRRVRVHDAAVTVEDRRLGLTWRLSDIGLDLKRNRSGGADGNASAALALGDLAAHLTAEAKLDAAGAVTSLAAELSPIVPAALARALSPGLGSAVTAPLAMLDAPVGLAGSARLGPGLELAEFTAKAEIGSGSIHLGKGDIPVLSAHLALQGSPAQVAIRLSDLVTAPRPDGPRTTFSGHADLSRTDAQIAAQVTLDVDRVAFADLPALWPEGVGGRGSRPWVTQNITAGTAHDGHVEVALTAPADLSAVTVTRVAGGIDGSDLTVHWLRPAPPITDGAARLNFLSPESVEILGRAGRVVLGREGAIEIRGGRVVLTGFDDPDQFADIEADLAGPVPAALALLGSPPIRMLQRSPLPLHGAGGQLTGRMTVPRLPLRDDLKQDDVPISAALQLTALRLDGVVAGRDLERGTIDLQANPDGLHAGGRAVLAGIPAQLKLDFDFRAGPPSQVLQTVTVEGTLDAAALSGLGLDLPDMLHGQAATAATLTLRRDHRGAATVSADLAEMAIDLDRLDWTKPRGQAARLVAQIALEGDQIAGIERLHAEGERLRLDGSVAFAAGRPSLMRLDRAQLGGALDGQGTLRAPLRPGDPWQASLSGRLLDASAELRRRSAASPAAQPAAGAPAPKRPQPGPPFTVDARFDQVVLGPDRSITNVVAHAENDGEVMRRLSLVGRTADEPFRLAIEPHGRERRLSGSTADAGGLLRALDVIATMQGGRLTLSGVYDDSRPDHPLAGTAEITDFRIRQAPALARLLTAMTLYGLVNLVQGPGLGFHRLSAPFRLADDVLELGNSVAFSASLGMTAKGQLDLARRTLDLRGTIVPAYFFNSLLGNIPLLGRLFSPEPGSGLFAASYAVRGTLADPQISVNPLAALTPGFLREVFGLFGGSGGRGGSAPVTMPSRASGG